MANRAAQIRAENAGLAVTGRGRNHIEFDAGDGRRRQVVTIDPLHIAGTETEIDTAWQPTSGVWQHQMLAADFEARAKASFNGAPLVEFRKGVEWITLQPQQLEYTNGRNDLQLISAVQAVNATVDDATLTWPGAFSSGRDFQWMAHPARLAKQLILQSALPAPSSQILGGALPVLRLQFVWAWSSGLTVWVNGAQWGQGGNRATADTTQAIEFRQGDGSVMARFDPAAVWDANDDRPAGIVQRVRSAGPNLFVEVRVPIAWLQAAAYPVVVDPTLTLQPDDTDGIDTFVEEADVNDNNSTNVTLSIRRTAGQRRTCLFKFDLSSIPGGATVDSGSFTAWLANSVGGASRTFTASRILAANSSWTEAASWNHAVPTTTRWAGDSGADGGADAGCSASGTDFSATPIGEDILGDGDTGPLEIAFSSMAEVEALIANNYGFVVWQSAESAAATQQNMRSSGYATAGERPKLVIEYTEAGGGGAISGETTGAATVTGALTGKGALSGLVSGVATVTAAIVAIGALAGTIAGTSTVTGTLTASGELAGTSEGIATVTGDLSGVGENTLIGGAAGTSTVTGTLTASGELAGTAAGIATIQGELTATGELAGTSVGIATVTGDLSGISENALAGTITGQATVTGVLTATGELIGTSEGVATVTGILVDANAVMDDMRGAINLVGNFVYVVNLKGQL